MKRPARRTTDAAVLARLDGLKQRRITMRLRLEDVAGQIVCSVAGLSQWERGQRIPDAASVASWEAALARLEKKASKRRTA